LTYVIILLMRGLFCWSYSKLAATFPILELK
jgi:hypothetical protein